MTSLGGHGRTHAPLPALPVPERRDEIAGGRANIARMTGDAPPGFAYPHGSLDRQTEELVREAGYDWAVTSRYDVIHPRHHDLYRLPRLAVGDWSAGRLSQTIAGIGG
ncbi:polysaccharide deacetylase family protein [Altericroceibacterium xinjiangense]|uniref:polysaccharide deacetylase family protein n=1 Tax=Altericroceibacterium xinjiangense TaxID=762261 RepID=UPI000F7E1F2A|nr:polysaccharide deacetylase family protein [Altericroceibacterium xinjiangense]